MQHNYIIVEDNPGAAENLKLSLTEFRNFSLKGVADNIKSALTLCLTEKPDLIFLDVELGNESGFDLINELRKHITSIPQIIMTTAYDHYGKQAVNNDVLYFLSKPIDPDELAIAMHKFTKNEPYLLDFIAIKERNGHLIAYFKDIVYLEASNNYSTIFLKNKKRITVSKTLKDIEKLLPSDFMRIHKSFMVNIAFIEKVNTVKQEILLRSFQVENEIVSKDVRKTDLKTSENFSKTTLPIGDSYLDNLKNTILIHKF